MTDEINWDDKHQVLVAIRKDTGNTRHASERLRDDLEVMTTAVYKWPHAIEFASDRLKNNCTLCFLALDRAPKLLEELGTSKRGDVAMVHIALKGVEHDYRKFLELSDCITGDLGEIIELVRRAQCEAFSNNERDLCIE